MHCHASIVTVVQWLITSVALVTRTENWSCWACVFWCFEDSFHKVMWVCIFKVTYAPFYLLTHLVIFAEIMTTRSPSHSGTITPSLTITRTMQKHSASHFKLHFLQAHQSMFLLFNPRVWPDGQPGTDSAQKLCRFYKPYPLHWLRKLRR